MQTRTIILDQRQRGQNLLQVLESAFRLSRPAALHHLKSRHVWLDGRGCADPNRRVRAGQELRVQLPDPPSKHAKKPVREVVLPEIARQIVVRYVDVHIIVVEKPAGLTTVRHAHEAEEFGKRAQKFLPATLVDLLPHVVPKGTKGRIRAVHRLDKETTGLMVLARTPEAESDLGKQFRKHTVGRHYLALVRGQAKDARIESRLVPDRGDGRRGSTTDADGQKAITHVRAVERVGPFTLIECSLETGRTHQVRIHLGEAGTPLCGERIYDRPLHGQPLADRSHAKRPMLHAATLEFVHPQTGDEMAFEAELPADMATLIRKNRQRREG